jgi:hypothetical protein
MLKGFILGVITTLFLTGATLSSIKPDVARDKICSFVNYIFGKGKDLSQKYKQNRDRYYEEGDSF